MKVWGHAPPFWLYGKADSTYPKLRLRGAPMPTAIAIVVALVVTGGLVMPLLTGGGGESLADGRITTDETGAATGMLISWVVIFPILLFGIRWGIISWKERREYKNDDPWARK